MQRKDFEELVANIHNQYFSSERYYPRVKAPHVTVKNSPMLLSTDNGMQIFQHALCSYVIKELVEALTNEGYRILNAKNPDQTIYQLSAEIAAADILGLADCGELTAKLIFCLMKRGISEVSRCIIEDGQTNHAFVMVSIENRDYALDPFFNIFCLSNEYYSHDKVTSYFSAATKRKSWLAKESKINATGYEKKVYSQHIANMENQIQFLKTISTKEIENILNKATYIKNLTSQNYDIEIAIDYLKYYFVKMTKAKCSSADIDACFERYRIFSQSFLLFGSASQASFVARAGDLFVKNNDFKPFADCIEKREWSRALRTACTSLHPDAYQIISIYLDYKDKLSIKINEQAGKLNQAAIHYAAVKKNRPLVELLMSHGADANLKDVNGFCANDFLKVNQSRDRQGAY